MSKDRMEEIINRKPSRWGNLTLYEFERDIRLLQEQAEQNQNYKNVINHLENVHKGFCEDEVNEQVQWVSGWGAAIDFIEENLGWEETDEAKTIIEENKELKIRVQELERKCDLLERMRDRQVYQKERAHYYNSVLEQQNKCYREAIEKILEEAYEEAGLHPDTNMQLETYIARLACEALEESE